LTAAKTKEYTDITMAKITSIVKGLSKGLIGTTSFMVAAKSVPLEIDVDENGAADLGYERSLIPQHKKERTGLFERHDDEKNEATVNILLVRNGQNEGMDLTAKGHNQISSTGQKLSELDFPKTHYFTRIYTDPSHQSFQTANILTGYLPEVRLETDLSIPSDGGPKKPTEEQLETAFRKYVRRAHDHQKGDSYQVVVCDADFIRYTVNRSLPLDPSFWEQFNLKHGSLTMLSVLPNGDVKLRCLGDAAHQKRR